MAREEDPLAGPGTTSPDEGQSDPLYPLYCPSLVRAESEECCEVYRMMPGYRVGRRGRREADIRQEIRTQGPVQATMDVYQVLSYNKVGNTLVANRGVF